MKNIELIQNSETGLALPNDFPLTYCKNWSSYIDGDKSMTLGNWKPFANLARRVRRHCRKRGITLTKFKPFEQDIKDNIAFPIYWAQCTRRGESVYVSIYSDTDYNERVIVACGPALNGPILNFFR